MSRVVGTVDVYNVAPVAPGRVRLEMILKTAEFPDFAVDLDAAVAKRVGLALLATAETQLTSECLGTPPQGASHGD